MQPDLAFAPFNQVLQQLLDPGSLLAGDRSGLNVILLRPGDLAGAPPTEIAAALGGTTARTHRRWHADPRTVNGFNRLWKEMVYQVVATRMKGSRLWDVDGNEYVDLVNGFGPNFLGHSPDFVTEAIQKQLATGLEIGPQCFAAMETSRLFCEVTGNERVCFLSTGSEAMQAWALPIGIVGGKAKYMNTFDGGHWQYGDDLFPEKEVTFFAGTFTRLALAMVACHVVLTHLKAQGPEYWEQIGSRADRLAHTVDRMFRDAGIDIQLVKSASQMFLRVGPDARHGNLISVLRIVARVFQGLPCALQKGSALRLHQLRLVRTDAGERCIERVTFDHAEGWNAGEAALARHQVLPEFAGSRRAGEMAGHADDVDGWLGLGIFSHLRTGRLNRAKPVWVRRARTGMIGTVATSLTGGRRKLAMARALDKANRWATGNLRPVISMSRWHRISAKAWFPPRSSRFVVASVT